MARAPCAGPAAGEKPRVRVSLLSARHKVKVPLLHAGPLWVPLPGHFTPTQPSPGTPGTRLHGAQGRRELLCAERPPPSKRGSATSLQGRSDMDWGKTEQKQVKQGKVILAAIRPGPFH